MNERQDLIGVHPGCGCVSAWMSREHSTPDQIREFYESMADTGREVRFANVGVHQGQAQLVSA